MMTMMMTTTTAITIPTMSQMLMPSSPGTPVRKPQHPVRKIAKKKQIPVL